MNTYRLKKRLASRIKRLRDFLTFLSLGQGLFESWDKAGRTL
jgi:hypothetical protein